uniref:Uncharacterized protein n=1 Tax=Hyaloperonospora arabidopsidis (strain Emoy2) TaxID=559515 RepID=M4BPI2_HYAAE
MEPKAYICPEGIGVNHVISQYIVVSIASFIFRWLYPFSTSSPLVLNYIKSIFASSLFISLFFDRHRAQFYNCARLLVPSVIVQALPSNTTSSNITSQKNCKTETRHLPPA